MKRTQWIVAVCLTFILMFPAYGHVQAAPPTRSEPSSVLDPLHVEGTRLVGSNGEPVQLRGVSTHGLAWFPGYINEDCFRQLRQEWNANVVRLALYTQEYGGYCSGGDPPG